MQLHDLSVEEYLTDKYALWLDRMIDEIVLHGMGRRMENALKKITLQIEKKAETPAGVLKAYIYLIMDAQLNIKDGVLHSTDY